ncbi:MAG TPA: hypothetical protein DCL73_16880 [Treponema sp.]|nr:hypothetical protein [Treponema sp.]
MVSFAEIGQIHDYVRLIFQLTRIPISLYVVTDDAKRYHRIFIYPDIPEVRTLTIPLDLEESLASVFSNSVKEVIRPCIFTEENAYTVFSIPFILIRKPGQVSRKILLVVGPCFQEPVQKENTAVCSREACDASRIHSWKNKARGCFRFCSEEEIKNAGMHIPYWNLPHLCAVVQIFYVMLFNQQISIAEIMTSGIVNSDAELGARITAELFQRREQYDFHTSFSQEMRIWDTIREGNVDGLPSALKVEMLKTPGILAKTRVRQEKNLDICTVAIATRFAIQGGVPDDIAYAMSDSFIQKVEEMSNVQDIIQFNNTIIIEFTKIVAECKHKQQRHCSPEINKCINYIEQNLHSKITLKDISGQLHISISQISRKFKDETGESIVDFCNRQRIIEACRLLEYSEKSLLDISTTLAFSSQSYFSALFKKYTGKSPLGYKRRCRESGTQNSIK